MPKQGDGKYRKFAFDFMNKAYEQSAKNTEKAQDIVKQEATSSTSSTGKSITKLINSQPTQQILETAIPNTETDIKNMEKGENIASYYF